VKATGEEKLLRPLTDDFQKKLFLTETAGGREDVRRLSSGSQLWKNGSGFPLRERKKNRRRMLRVFQIRPTPKKPNLAGSVIRRLSQKRVRAREKEGRSNCKGRTGLHTEDLLTRPEEGGDDV